MAVSRRACLAAAGAFGLTALIGCGRELSARDLDLYFSQILETLAVPDPIAIGTAYLAAEAKATDLPDLRQVLGQSPDLSPQALANSLRRQYRQDFEAGRVHRVAGWWLSATECSLCAWLSLDLG